MSEPREQGVAASETAYGGSPGALALVLALSALALLLVLYRHRPPAPRPASAPPAEFSAGRAGEVLRRLVGDGRPHPLGSAAEDRVRHTIVGILDALGVKPHVEEGFACSWSGSCARVRNVVARIDGREPGPAVGLTAHYDSVPAGPGASDDLAGVAAILEIARALVAGPPPRHPVLVLLDDGEEGGLLGARAFEEASPEAADLKAVVNLEARGTGGPSFMFETSGDNAWLVDAWAGRVPRPVTTSLAAFIYSLLPNDTDLTVFRHYQVPGLNFAYIDGATRYHTSTDDLAHTSLASLQHQGDNALAAVTALAGTADLAHPPRGDAAFFDLLSVGIVRWPLDWTPAMAAAGLLLLLLAAAVSLGRRTVGGGDLALGLLMVPAVTLPLALLAWGLSLGLHAAGVLSATWLAHPLPALAAFWLLALTLAAAVAWMLGRGGRTAPLGLWLGVWTIWAVLGMALAVLAPATSYVFVLPALAAGICGVLARVWRGLRAASGALVTAAIVPAVTAAVLWWGVLPPVYTGMGVPALPMIATLLGIVFATLAPLIAAGGLFGRRLWTLALAAAVVALLTALAQPPADASSPRPLSFTFYQDGDSGLARWVAIGPVLPPPVRRAAAFGPPVPAYPWSPPSVRYVCAPAPPLTAAGALPPELRVLENTVAGGVRHLRLRLVSRRGAPIGTLLVPARARPSEVRIDGHLVPRSSWRGPRPQPQPSEWLSFSDPTLPPAGCELDMVLQGTGPLELYAVDASFGLPPSGAGLLAARPPQTVPMQQGDTTLISRRLRL
jgi:hypothetical protein